MSNHKARTWDHKKSKSLDPKFLLIDDHLDSYQWKFLETSVRGFGYVYPWIMQLSYRLETSQSDSMFQKKKRWGFNLFFICDFSFKVKHNYKFLFDF
jgi:hypothetical protein